MRGHVDLFWKDSMQAHDTATERAITARMLPTGPSSGHGLFRRVIHAMPGDGLL